jgi:aminoglycoside 3-N-acetyltransferase
MMLTRDRITTRLREAGIKPGDDVLVHSSLRAVGPIDGGADALIDGLLAAVGPGGTLVMPAFNYTRPLPQPHFDPRTTPGKTGALTEVFRKRPGVLRSLSPTHSVAAAGPRAAEFTDGHLDTQTFGLGSPIDKLASGGGWVLLVGVTHTSNSTIHVGETHAGVTKFAWNDGPLPSIGVKMPDGRVVEHAIDTTPSCSLAFNALDYPLRRNGEIIDLTLGAAPSHLMRGADVIARTVEIVRSDPSTLFCTRADCRPCRLGREHVRKTVRD